MSDITTAFTDEVVTNAFTKIVSVPGLDGSIALVTLDNGFDHTKPSTFGPGGLAKFDAALDEAFAANPVAIAVTGKPFIFAVGADLNGVPNIKTKDEALQIGQLGHKVFRRLRESTIPTFASSTVLHSAAASKWDCTRTTAPSPRTLPRSVCPRPSSAWYRDGAEPSCCPTSSEPRTPSPSSSRTR